MMDLTRRRFAGNTNPVNVSFVRKTWPTEDCVRKYEAGMEKMTRKVDKPDEITS
jgi:hypothetical protein